MAVLDTLAVNIRTKLAEISGLTALPENVSIEDVPDSDKSFFSVEVGELDEMGAEHGGGTYIERIGELAVKLAWLIDDDEEAFHDTKAQHLQSVHGVMDKVSNWTSGVVLLTRAGQSARQEETLCRADLTYRVRYRVAQDLT